MNNQEDLNTEEQESVAKFNLVNYFDANKKTVLIAVGAILVLSIAYFGYKEFIQKPKAKEGVEVLKDVQNYYGKDSFLLVINGTPAFPSAVEIAEDYSGTKAGELADFYAGTSYLQLGEYESAIIHLERVHFSDKIMKYQTYGALGDAYVETKNLEKGLKMYKKAAEGLKGEMAANFYLKAGIVLEELEDYEGALAIYTEASKEVDESTPLANKIERNMAKANVLLNK